MSKQMEDLARKAAAGLGRRDVLMSAVGVLATAALAGIKKPVAAQTVSTSARRQLQSVTVRLFMPTGHVPQFQLNDRYTGSMKFAGRQYTFMPAISAGQKAVELSIFDSSTSRPILAQKVNLPLWENDTADVGPTASLSLPSWPTIAVGAIRVKEVDVLASQLDVEDCSVNCCWGGSMSAGACCCDRDKPDTCGACCDAGFCPACS